MRITLDGIPLLSPKTGIGRYTSELAAALRLLPGVSRVRFCYGIHWYTCLRGTGFAGDEQSVVKVEENKIKRRETEFLKTWLTRQAAKLEFAVRRSDIFHATNYVVPAFCNVPTVVTIHDLSFLRHSETHPPERLKWLEQGLPDTMDRAEAIIADSRFTKNELVSLLGVSANRVRVVHLGVTPHYNPKDKASLVEKLKVFDLSPDGYVLSVGTLEPRKNISSLLNAYEMLPSSLKERWPLVIVGLRGWKDHALADRVEKLSRSGSLRHLGYVADDQLPFIYAGATLFVYPSLYEGFGLPLLEAMACGVPAIASNRASLPEVLGEAGALVDPEDVDSMARLIETILEDEGMRREMTRLGLVQASSFTWATCAEKTLRVYREALGKNKS